MKIYPVIFAQIVAYHYIAVAAKFTDKGMQTFLVCLVTLGMLASIFIYLETNKP